MTSLENLEDNALVTVDTAPIIYILEDNSRFAEKFHPLFQQIESGRIRPIISPVTIAEVLAGPLSFNNEILANRYFTALSSLPWKVQDLTAELSFLAARIQIRYQLKLPDAMQIATAIHTGSSALITHDRDFRGVDEITILGME